MLDTVSVNLILQLTKELSDGYLGNFIFSPVLLSSMLRTISEASSETKKLRIQFILSMLSRDSGCFPVDDIFSDERLLLFRNFILTEPEVNVSPLFLEHIESLGIKISHSHLDFTKNPFKQFGSIISAETLELMPSSSVFRTGNIKTLFLSTAYFQHAWQTSLSLESPLLFTQHFLGSQIKTDMLKGFAETYTETPDYVGFIKEYSGEKYCFMALMPKDERRMSPPDGEEFYAAMLFKQQQGAEILMPKFSFEIDTYLGNMLDKRFSLNAEFETETPSIKIDEIIQKSKIVVDKHGMSPAVQPSKKLKPENVVLDRPFWFFVIDKACDELVLVGRVACPSAD